MEITNEVSKYIDSITKRVYPLTDKEKNCINEFGKMHVNRGHLKKAIIETITKTTYNDESGIVSRKSNDDL
jgi:hypothetical protein